MLASPRPRRFPRQAEEPEERLAGALEVPNLASGAPLEPELDVVLPGVVRVVDRDRDAVRRGLIAIPRDLVAHAEGERVPARLAHEADHRGPPGIDVGADGGTGLPDRLATAARPVPERRREPEPERDDEQGPERVELPIDDLPEERAALRWWLGFARSRFAALEAVARGERHAAAES